MPGFGAWHVQPIDRTPGVPPGGADLPPIDAVRPPCCPRCGALARVSGALNLWGHGTRWRDVIAPGEPGERVVSAWVWRFSCQKCETTCSVSADSLLARRRYTLAAILTAWFLAVRRPIGDGRAEEAVYALVGVDRRVPGPDPDRAGKPRWRSLSRWAAKVPAWWPARPVSGSTWRERAAALLAGFIAGNDARDGAIRRALDAHAAAGRPM